MGFVQRVLVDRGVEEGGTNGVAAEMFVDLDVAGETRARRRYPGLVGGEIEHCGGRACRSSMVARRGRVGGRRARPWIFVRGKGGDRREEEAVLQEGSFFSDGNVNGLVRWPYANPDEAGRGGTEGEVAGHGKEAGVQVGGQPVNGLGEAWKEAAKRGLGGGGEAERQVVQDER